MPALTKFGQFMATTRERLVTGPEDIINDATKNSYLLGYMMRMNKTTSIRGGSQIGERVQLEDGGTSQFYSPGDTLTPSRKNTIKTLSWAWRFFRANTPYTDAEVMLNEGANELSKFKNFRKTLRQQLHTDHWNGLEKKLWERPNEATMETIAADPGQMYSIPAYITEGATWLPPGWAGGTVAQLSPSANPGWRPKKSTYTAADIFHPTTGLLAAFDDLFLQIKFVEPVNGQYFENDDMSEVVVCTNRDGMNTYQQALREGNDQYRGGPQDPAYGRPVYKGAPVIYISELDDALLDEASGAYTGTAYPTGAPRFFAINCRYLYPVFHAERVMQQMGPIAGGVNQPDTETLLVVSWINVVCRSRRRQGIIAPA